MVVQTKSAEYFGLAEELHLGLSLYEMDPNRPVLCYKYDGYMGANGRPTFSVVQTKFLNRTLKIVSEEETLFNPNKYFISQTFTKELFMNIPELIKAANEFNGNVDAVETLIRKKQAEQIKWALKRAERENEFVAMACLAELQERYPLSNAPKTELSEDERKKAVEVTIKTKDVPAGTVEAVFSKARKIGKVVTETTTNGVFLIKKTESDAFIKAAQAIKGFTVEAVKPGK